MSTPRDIIARALRILGVLASGETPSNSEQNDSFTALQDMMSDWSNQSLFVYSTVRESFSLIPGQQNYTMGPGGNFSTTRPQRIEEALMTVQLSPETELPIKLVTEEEFAEIIVKSITTSIPLFLYPDYAYPLMNISLWPIPTVTLPIILYSWKALTSFATVNDTVSLPPGYQRALIYNLAVELAAEFGRDVKPTILALAVEAKANIKRLNIKANLMKSDPAILTPRSSFNWYTGE